MYLGGIISGDGEIVDKFEYKSKDLSTHSMILGMTGSGKTALGIIMIEELLKEGKSVIAIDLKGDLTNLLLNFPDFSPEEFKMWVKGKSEEEAVKEAKKWKNGLKKWGIDSEYMRILKENVSYTIYTPNSDAGTPLDISGILSENNNREALSIVVDSILSLIGVKNDSPLSRESLLISSIIDFYAKNGEKLTFQRLIEAIQNPPFEKIGVFKVDRIYPLENRMELAFKINSLLASPYMSGWFKGKPFNIGNMISNSGVPKCSILYLAHLNDRERMFAISLLFSQLIVYMRTQSGSDELKSAIYFDEVFGYIPPYPDNPPSKKAIMTLLKQARAFGIGLILSTQNPVDIDYKAIGNMGTWFIGRLITKQDRKRLLDGMSLIGEGVDKKTLSEMISSLKTREFIYKNSRRGELKKITTRWAISYLKGPLTPDEIKELKLKKREEQNVESKNGEVEGEEFEGKMEVIYGSKALLIFQGDSQFSELKDLYSEFVVTDYFCPFLLAKVKVDVNSARYNLYGELSFFRVLGPLNDNFIDEWRNLYDFSLDGISFKDTGKFKFSKISPQFFDKREIDRLLNGSLLDVLREEKLTLYVNRFFKMKSFLGESREDFLKRIHVRVDGLLDEKSEKLKERYGNKLLRLKERLERKNYDYEIAKREYEGRKKEEFLGAGESFLSFLLGHKSRSFLSKAVRKRRLTERMELRVKKLESEMEMIKENIESLESDFKEKMDELREEIERNVDKIAEIKIKFKKKDIFVDEFFTLWLPFGGKSL